VTGSTGVYEGVKAMRAGASTAPVEAT
jgi:hypothetical protein